jgi:hypothetical protein
VYLQSSSKANSDEAGQVNVGTQLRAGLDRSNSRIQITSSCDHRIGSIDGS